MVRDDGVDDDADVAAATGVIVVAAAVVVTPPNGLSYNDVVLEQDVDVCNCTTAGILCCIAGLVVHLSFVSSLTAVAATFKF